MSGKYYVKKIPSVNSVERPFKNLIEHLVSLLVLEGRILCVEGSLLLLSSISLSLSPSFLSPLLFM